MSPPSSPVTSTSHPSRPNFLSSRTSKILSRSQKVQEALKGATVVKHGWRSIRDALKGKSRSSFRSFTPDLTSSLPSSPSRIPVARFEHMSEVDGCVCLPLLIFSPPLLLSLTKLPALLRRHKQQEGAELRQHTAFSASQLLASPPILSPPLDGQTSAFIFPIPTSPKKEVAGDAESTFSKIDSNIAIVAPVKDGRLRDLARE